MKKTALIKDVLRDIMKSKGRFLSIVVIIALGVAFFSGLKMAPESMEFTADKYYDDYNLMDIRLVSTLGLTEEDLEEVAKIKGVNNVFGSYTMDVLAEYEEREVVLKAFGYDKGSNINEYKLLEGRMPENPGEAVLEKVENGGLEVSIGSTIKLFSGKEDPLSEDLKNTEYKIVGIVQTPFYLSFEKGNSNIGNGKVKSFIVIPQENFKLDVYTDIFLTVEGAKAMNSYKDEYFDLVDPITEDLKLLAKEREFIRYEDIIREGKEEIEEGRAEYLEEKEKAEKELNDALKEIEDGKKEISDGEKEIQEGRQKIKDAEEEIKDGEKEIADAMKEIEEGEEEIAKAEKEIQDGEKEIADGEQEIRDAEKEIADGEKEIQDAIKKIQDGEKEIRDGEKELKEAEEKIKDGEKEIRDGEIEIKEAEQEIRDGEGKLKNEEAKFYQSIEEGRRELEDGEAKLRDGERQYEGGLREFNEKKAMAEAGFKEAEKGIVEGEAAIIQLEEQKRLLEMALQNPELPEEKKPDIRVQLQELEAILAGTRQKIESGKAELAAGKAALAAGERELNQVREQLDSSWAELEYGRRQLREGEAEGKRELEKARKELEDGKADIKEGKKKLEDAKKELEDGRKELADGKIELEDARKEIADGKKELEDAKKELATGKKELEDAKKEIEDAKKELEEGRKELEDAKLELEDGRKEIEDAKIKLEDGRKEIRDAKIEIADARIKIEDAKIELEDGIKEYEEGKEKADKELGEALEEIEDGERELRKIEKGKWYVLDRTKHYSYMDYGGAADRMNALSKVFPVFFALVAALVCLTSMTRMVDEQRINIGTLKALGYARGHIAAKYIFYASTATILGSIIGLALGYSLFPTVIFNAYGIMYLLPEISLVFNKPLSIAITLGALLLTTGTTFIASSNELRETPAILMRPKAPKMGKRILLERIPIIWNRFNFSYKVTVRNIFRYKRRFLMTVFGIAGCTALMLTAFGIRDSIRAVVDRQYGALFNYDISIGLDEEGIKYLDDNDKIKSYELLLRESGELTLNNHEKEISIIVPKNIDNIDSFIRLQDRKTEKILTIPEEGAIITEQISKDFNLNVGDEILLKNSEKDEATIKISGVTENYTFNYVYLSPKHYEDIFPEKVKYNEAIGKIENTTAEFEDILSRELIENEGINNVSYTSGLKENFEDTIASIIYVVLLMIISAGALAFVVLYNLTNVNISERIREIATIKVLGFYDNEVSAYIYRENTILTFIGIGLGLIIGKYLHIFIMLTVEMDNIMFGLKLDPKSYLMAIGLTIFFSVLVNIVMHYKLRDIAMVESLKSVD